ncbi:hypothetical protein SNEBB_009161 [Seison nebaliae]|nr:hypothetical protein SNEBB_009161 [Seison nebaliae]
MEVDDVENMPDELDFNEIIEEESGDSDLEKEEGNVKSDENYDMDDDGVENSNFNKNNNNNNEFEDGGGEPEKFEVNIRKQNFAETELAASDINYLKLIPGVIFESGMYKKSGYVPVEVEKIKEMNDEDQEAVLSYIQLQTQRTCRWRLKKQKNHSKNYLVPESNTRLVKWSDGSYSLHIGKSTSILMEKSSLHGFRNHIYSGSIASTSFGQHSFQSKFVMKLNQTDNISKWASAPVTTKDGGNIHEIDGGLEAPWIKNRLARQKEQIELNTKLAARRRDAKRQQKEKLIRQAKYYDNLERIDNDNENYDAEGKSLIDNFIIEDEDDDIDIESSSESNDEAEEEDDDMDGTNKNKSKKWKKKGNKKKKKSKKHSKSGSYTKHYDVDDDSD